jgi:Chaperone of endosialidase
MKNFAVFIFTLFSLSNIQAQIGINTDNSAPHSSAILDVKSNTKAFYPPRMTTAEKNAIAGIQAGAVVYDVTLGGLNYYNGTSWVSGGGSGFALPFVGSNIDNAGVGLFKINESGATVNGIGIVGTSTNGTGLFGYTNSYRAVSGQAVIGVAGYFNSTFGTALLTKGALQFGGSGVGTLGVGKFLKSTSVNGDAQWADFTPMTEVKSINNNLIYVENTLAANNLAAIAGTTNSSTTGAGIAGTASNTAPTIDNAGIRGINKSTNTFGYGVEGIHEGDGAGVYGKSGYFGVKGEGGTFGVYGLGQTGVKGLSNHWITGWGVWGEALGTGIYGKSTGTAGVNYGVYGESISTAYSAAGLYGKGKYKGVLAESDGTGVLAIANDSAPTFPTYGIEARNYSTNDLGFGVWGSINGGGVGIYGRSESGEGIIGTSTSGAGGKFSSTTGYALITTNGKVGIDTADPAAKLDIRGTTYLSHFYFGDNEDTYIRGGKAGSRVLINDINGQGSVGIGIASPNQYLDVNGRMRIYHKGSNTAGIWLSNAVNGLAGNDGAFVGINCSAAGSETVGFFVGGNWRFDVDRAGNGRFGGAVTTTSGFLCASDFRYKKNIMPLENALLKIQKINGVSYNWRKEEFPDRNFSNQNQIGFIAQDLEKIYPEMVFTDEKGYKSVDYARLTPVLVEAIKELSKENISLKENQKTVEVRLQKLEEIFTAFAKK